MSSLQTALNGRLRAEKKEGGLGGGTDKCASHVTLDGRHGRPEAMERSADGPK